MSKKNLPAKQLPQTPPEQTQMVAASFQGPLPPPSHLANYDAIVPGSAERILQMAESSLEYQKEQMHKQYELEKGDQELEQKHLENEHAKIQIFARGQYIAAGITLVGLGLAGYGLASEQSVGVICGMVTALVPFLTRLLPSLQSKRDLPTKDS
jgi:uncharacterized membrane protein